MTRQEKQEVVENLKKTFSEYQYFYVADSSTLTVADINDLRGACFEKGIKMQVVKNTLAKRALQEVSEDSTYEPLYGSLVGPTTLMFTTVANSPAKVIKEFRKKDKDKVKPELKAAYIDTDVFIGDDQVDVLAALKSKEELIGEIIGLLESPIKNVLGSLQSGGSTIAGLLKTLEERAQ